MLSSCEEVECSHATGNDGPKRSYQPEPGWCGHFPPEPRPFGIQLDTFIIWHSRRCRHPLSAHECRRRRDVAPNYRHTTHRADDVFCPPRPRSEEQTSELQSRFDVVCRLLLEETKRGPVTPFRSRTR